MKKVLILAYDFPPYVSVGGLRPYNWYKYLNEFGVYPIVITRQWDNKYGNHLDYIAPSISKKNIIEEDHRGTIIRTPYTPNFANRLMLKYGESKYRFIRKAFTAYYEFTQFLFLVGPKSALYFAGEQYLKENKVDVIIATGDPFVLFHYASKLSKKYAVPWIADYRDPWSQKNAIQENILMRNWHNYFEKKIVTTSSLISTVSEFFQTKISKIFKQKTIFVLPNGYDPEAIEQIKDTKQQSQILKISYVGYIYDWHPIRRFLSVFSKFINDKKEVKIMLNFYGINIAEELQSMINNDYANIKEYITIYPKTPNDLLLQNLASENIMLLFNYYSFPGTKIYDYIGLKRAILFCFTDDSEANKLKKRYYPYGDEQTGGFNFQEKIINETKSGYIIKDADHLYSKLEQLYDEFIKKGYIECSTINSENYSRRHQVKELSEIIKHNALLN